VGRLRLRLLRELGQERERVRRWEGEIGNERGNEKIHVSVSVPMRALTTTPAPVLVMVLVLVPVLLTWDAWRGPRPSTARGRTRVQGWIRPRDS